ncbi:hypothetical protein EBU91_01635 [bacterium]|nr:hypothetical protein [bacterium]
MKKIVFSIFLLLLTYLNITIYLQNLVIGVLTPVIIQLRVLSLDLSDSLRFYQNIERIRQENIELRKKVSIHEIIFYDDSGSEIYLKDFTESGVKTGDLLILGRNLIGIISYVDMGIIKADLLSKNSNQINSYILNSDNQKITTIITGEAGDNLVINNILATEIVSEGDLILTSSTNPKILADLIIGRIQRLEGISSQTFRKATIRKNYDLNFMKFIGVLSL